jgi:hypothetical protein
MGSRLVLEKNLTVVSSVAFVELHADQFRPKPAITNQENNSRTVHLFLMMNLLSKGDTQSAWAYG